MMMTGTMTLKVHVVDNGGQWTHREWRVLNYLGVECSIISNTTPFEELDVDGLVLSGGAPRIGTEAIKLGRTGEYIDKAAFPIFGICVGMQFMVLHHGGEAGPAEVPEFGKVECFVDEHDELLKGLPDRFVAWESHNDEVKALPDGFEILAHSENCRVQAYRHVKRPLFGTQFHPEVEQTEHGYDIFKNFLEVCKG
jgi:GMP synthase (glutamine-hydrolysing)